VSVPDTVVYVDTSALVKLIVDEPETDAVRAELQQRYVVATSVITEIELARAASRARDRSATAVDDVAVWAITAAMLEVSRPPATAAFARFQATAIVGGPKMGPPRVRTNRRATSRIGADCPQSTAFQALVPEPEKPYNSPLAVPTTTKAPQSGAFL
jgi:hypothetical protein